MNVFKLSGLKMKKELNLKLTDLFKNMNAIYLFAFTFSEIVIYGSSGFLLFNKHLITQRDTHEDDNIYWKSDYDYVAHWVQYW